MTQTPGSAQATDDTPPIEEVTTPDAGVDSTERGEVVHARYSPAGIREELSAVVWPSARSVAGALAVVTALATLLAVGVHWLDQLTSSVVLDLLAVGYQAQGAVLPVLVAVQVAGALVTGYYALRHPSPGDTLASIFGGQITAQGSGLTPKQRRLARKMGASLAVFFVATFALGFFI